MTAREDRSLDWDTIRRRLAGGGKHFWRGLEELAGIRLVKANPATGNVLILFEPAVATQDQIIDRLVEMNGFAHSGLYLTSERQIGGRVAETLVQSAVQVALERVILALV